MMEMMDELLTKHKSSDIHNPQSTPDTAQPNTKSYKQHHLPVSEAMQSVQKFGTVALCSLSYNFTATRTINLNIVIH